MNYWKITSVAISVSFTINVNAAIIGADWQTAGDNLITRDTDTGLNWLNLSETRELSYNTVIANLGAGGTFQGFRVATQSEVLTLWGNAGIINTERTWVTDQFTAVKSLVDRLGRTQLVEPGDFPIASHTIGMVEGGPALSSDLRWAMELTYAPDDLNSRTSANYYTRGINKSGSIHYSTYIVQVVPVPAAIWLFGTGLISLFCVARNKSKN